MNRPIRFCKFSRAIALWLTLFCLALPSVGSAQAFAPGKLSQAHSQWESLSNCDKCHTAGRKVDRSKCLSCHQPVATRIKQKKGFHGQKRVRSLPCESCHPEHRGTDAPLIRWDLANRAAQSPSSRQQDFDHDQTGWPLRGAHAKVKCADCHQVRLIRDRDVRKYIDANGDADTFQGLSTRCIDCHFDEHRGQLKKTCDSCHNETSFKPVPKFNHDKTWRLEGAHKKVKCVKCHPNQTDDAYSKTAFPKARAQTYLKMTPIPHDACTDCHKDPHRNRFGNDCLSCHNINTWQLDAPPKDIAFHDRTEFPLLGRHRFVPCERCHPRNAKGKMKLTPIAHDRCNNCHPNAHPDFSKGNYLKTNCDTCHSNAGFAPSLYSIADHQKTDFVLSDAHQAVPCIDCHLKKMGAPVASVTATRIKNYAAARVRSPWRMTSDIAPRDCSRCHQSPHRDQFRDTPCTNCHSGNSWHIDTSAWEHEKHSTYALKGRHKKVPCEKCHQTQTDLDGEFVRYRPIRHADCTPCHADQHLGQFQYLSPKMKCRHCHSETGFAPAKFDHNDPAFSSFPLKGKHKKVSCVRCHPRVTLENGQSTLRYRPTVTDCDLCHEDAHHGAFRDVSRRQRATLPAFKDSAATVPATDLWQPPKNWFPANDARTNCDICHSETDWHEVEFNHATTDFPLRGKHAQVACKECHTKDIQTPLPLDCAGCHQDVHKGSLGANCAECHNESGFDLTSPAVYARHNRTRFPLLGRHAAIPCTECHRDANGREFKKVPTDCVACHAKDIPGPGETSVDHSALNMGCERCHTPVNWKTAGFEGHDRCFPIGAFSKHGSVACTKCHQGAPPARLENCTTGSFSCIQCHGCETARHRNVGGYSCEDGRCYECHQHP